MRAIRVLIVDDHPSVRRGLRSLLSSSLDMEVIGESEDGAAALQAAIELSPDVILLDIRMPGPEGTQIAHQLHQQVPEARIIILTAYDHESYVINAMRAGAHAYVLKSTSDETVVETIRSVYHGKRALSASLMDKVLKQFQVLARDHAWSESNLSEQEAEVLNLMAQGATNKEIADEMYWSERSVKRVVQQIMDKLEARSRTHAVAKAIRRGLI